MLKRTLLFAALCGAMASGKASAQDLASLIPGLYGPNGLKVDSLAVLPNGETHTAHFNSSFQQSFTPFNVALATQLASVPLPSPASGFTFSFDSSLGVFKRSTQSFGPILTDRSETIGKKKISFGFSYQHFSFNRIDGMDVKDVPVVFTHDHAAPGGKADVVTTVNSIDATLGQFTAFVNYGLANRLDVAVAVPVVRVDLSVTSNATIQRIGTASNSLIHFFYTPDGLIGNQKTFTGSGNKTGIGDVILRLKGTAYQSSTSGVALGGEVRIPSGDERNLLGSGAVGVKPFAAYSYSSGTFSPHVNLAYEWNGKSILAGNVVTGDKESLPKQFFYSVGADVALGRRVTLAVDFLGRRVIDGEKLVPETFQALDNVHTFPTVAFEKTSYNAYDGAVGLKVNPGGRLLADINVLFRLNNSGLRTTVTPLIGIEYSF